MIAYLFLPMLLVPVVALVWRMVVSKTRASWVRIGAAVAATTSAVGAFMVNGKLIDFNFKDWREDVGLAAAASGSVYLLAWAQRPHGNRRHRTVSIIAAIIGLVPVGGAILTGILFGGQLR
jgi:hypothetical protein